MHLIWLAMCVPPMLFAAVTIPAMRSTTIWAIGFAVTLLTLALFVAFDLQTITSNDVSAQLVPQQIAFSVIRFTDFPLLALVLGSFFTLLLVRFGLKKIRPVQLAVG